MGCDRYREMLSAYLDDEAAPAERALVEVHLAACPDCRGWAEDAATVGRLVRVDRQPLPRGVPDSVLAALPGRAPARLATGLRVALGVLGAAQLLLAVAMSALPGMDGMAMTGSTAGATAGHLVHESSAWNFAIGAGFLYIAWRRSRPTGLVPVLSAFVAALVLLSADDLVSGAVAWTRLASHLLLVAGYVIVLALSREPRAPGEPPQGTARRWRLRAVATPPAEVGPVRGTTRRGPGRPTTAHSRGDGRPPAPHRFPAAS